MPYTARINSKNPTLFLFLIDQSYSMIESWDNENKSKSDAVPLIINRLFQNLILECAKGDIIKNYFYISALGYSEKVESAFSGKLAGREVVSISELADNPARVEVVEKRVSDGAGGLVKQKVSFPIWFDAKANGSTSMCQALNEANRIVNKWLSEYPNCFPPVIFNITDGEATDGDPTLEMRRLASLSSNDGNVLLFNLHLSAKISLSNDQNDKYSFASAGTTMPDLYAQQMFNEASYLTPKMVEYGPELGLSLNRNSKAFTLNATPERIIQALEIGTSTQTQALTVL